MWEGAEKFLAKDRYIGPLVKRYGHCRIRPRAKKYYFEDLVDSIVQQQLSMKAAASIFNRIKAKVADRKPQRSAKHRWRVEKTLKIRLTPKKILSLTTKQLRDCGLSKSKVDYIKYLAKKVSDGEIEIHKMNKMSDKEIVEKLISVKGIGRWTVEMFLMFTLARPDVFPVDDLGLRNAFNNLIEKMEKKDMVEFARRWKPYRTTASWYIWKSL